MPNGKAKGSSFERSVSKTLSRWWSKEQRDDLFWRSQNSGGRYTIRKRKDLDTYHQGGDICDIHPDAKLFCDIFVCECKHYKDIGIWTIVTGKGKIKDWWVKTTDLTKSCNKIPLIIAKENNKPILIFTSIDGFHIFNSCKDIKHIMTFKFDNEWVYVYLFDDILNSDADEFRAACQTIKDSTF